MAGGTADEISEQPNPGVLAGSAAPGHIAADKAALTFGGSLIGAKPKAARPGAWTMSCAGAQVSDEQFQAKAHCSMVRFSSGGADSAAGTPIRYRRARTEICT
jgi:hypothetical protein